MSPVTWLDLSSSQAPCHQWRSSTARADTGAGHTKSPLSGKTPAIGFSVILTQCWAAATWRSLGLRTDWLVNYCLLEITRKEEQRPPASSENRGHTFTFRNQPMSESWWSHQHLASSGSAVVTILSNVNLIETTRVSPTTLHSCCLHRDHYCKIEFLSTR